MNKFFRLFRIIHIHPLFWLVIGIASATAMFREVLVLFTVVFIHELGHAWAASFFSWRIKKILLLPFGGVLVVEENGNRPLKEELFVTLAGPVQHVWLLAISFILYEAQVISPDTHSEFVYFNLMIFLFNCLPILPLDGGKLMLILLSTIFPFARALKYAISISFLFLFAYSSSIILLFPYHLNAWLISYFLFISLYNEWKNRPYVWMRFLLERHFGQNGNQRMIKKIYVSPTETVQSVIQKFQRGTGHSIIVSDNGKVLNDIHESIILKNYFEGLAHRKMKDLLY